MAMSQMKIDGFAAQIAGDILKACVGGGMVKEALVKKQVAPEDITKIEAVIRDLAQGHKDEADKYKSIWAMAERTLERN